MTTTEFDDSFREVMSRKVGESNLSHYEVFAIGQTMLNWAQTVYRLGHASPASTLDYTQGAQDLFVLVVRDFVAWTCNRTDMVPGDVRERFESYLEAADWESHLVASIEDRLSEVAA